MRSLFKKKKNSYSQAGASHADSAKSGNTEVEETAPLVGEHLNFDGTEAFNLLRANLFLSFSDEKKSHVVGITSPSPGTGKSLIACNLAYSIAKSDAKVLLIEGDLRLPTIASKMHLATKPGLSNVLTSDVDPASCIQTYNGILDILVAGNIPPRPSELLGSPKMGELLEKLKQQYDYIVIDLSPVTVVPDTLSVSKYLDGIVLAVRREYDGKPMINEALRMLNVSRVNILGLVFNDGKNHDKEYRQYKHYGKKYGKAYSSYGDRE